MGQVLKDPSFFSDVTSHISSILSQLPYLRDPQISFWLLRCCLSLPKVNHLLRTAHPDFISDFANYFDSLIFATFVSIAGPFPVTSAASQTFLPIKLGGFGLRSAQLLSVPAFIGSFVSGSSTLLSFGPLFSPSTLDSTIAPLLATFCASISSTAPDFLFSPEVLSRPKLQHYLSEFCHKQAFSTFMSTLPYLAQTRVRLNTSNCAFLNCFPASNSPFILTSLEWIVQARLRLLCPVYSSDKKCPACAQGYLDIYGRHATRCPGAVGLTQRHDALKAVLASAVRLTGYGVTLERRLPGLNTTPGDIYIPSFGPRDLYIDVSFVDSEFGLSSSSPDAPFNPFPPLSLREQLKISKYLSACADINAEFLPFVISSSGLFAPAASDFLDKIVAVLLRKPGLVNPKRFIRDRILFSVGKSSASSIIARGHDGNIFI